MDMIRSYLISVAAAAILCAIIHEFAGNKGSVSSLIRLLTGLFMTVTVVSPLVKLELRDVLSITEQIQLDGRDIVSKAEIETAAAKAAIIKEETRAYILDKADALGLCLEVEVVLTDEYPQIPYRVHLKGDVSPYGRSQLAMIMEKKLGIIREEQHWSG